MSTEIQDLAPTMPTQYLRDFFAEKDIPEVSWELTSEDGTVHYISNMVVVEHIAQCSLKEANEIARILCDLDFVNGDTNHFLHHLAGALINR
jgi:hypothetical protein